MSWATINKRISSRLVVIIFLALLVLHCCPIPISALHNNCGIHIGEQDDNEKVHRRMVSMNVLTQGCENSDIIFIDIPHDNIERSFTKVKASLRQEKPPSALSPFSYWIGEDSTDGSIFNFVQDGEGHMSGSMIDLTNDNVLQFHNMNGIYMVTITASSDFDPELDPEVEEERRLAIEIEAGASKDDSKIISSSNQTSTEHQIVPLGNNFKDQIYASRSEEPLIRLNDERKLYDDNGGNLDVMVVWTKAAECEAFGQSIGCSLSRESESNMLALINLAIEETNNALGQSGVDTELLLVHAYRHPTYSELTSDPFRDSLNSLGWGEIPDVHSNRDTYGADIVSLIIYDGPACGVGYIGPHIDAMFSVAAWNCATGYYSFGHEIAHNLGCRHDRGTEGACNSGGYSYGYRDPNAKFRTILAYDCKPNQCDMNRGGGCSRIPMFSNPTFDFNSLAVGDTNNDNARAINDAVKEVAGYHKHVPFGNTTPSTNNECNDSRFRFRVIKGTESILRSCEWVQKRDTNNRCALAGVSSMCPKTCDTCSLCLDGENRMKFEWDNRIISRDCKWVGNKQTKQRCAVDGMKDACRATCNNCQ